MGLFSCLRYNVSDNIGHIYMSVTYQVEALAKKYEEKYKQTGDVASRLTIEEATFRDIQVFLVIYIIARQGCNW